MNPLEVYAVKLGEGRVDGVEGGSGKSEKIFTATGLDLSPLKWGGWGRDGGVEGVLEGSKHPEAGSASANT